MTAALRAPYARAMVAAAGVEDPALEAAFARVPREDFMPPGPWTLRRIPGETETLAHNDPASLYPQSASPEVLVVLDAARGVNNGAPSLHAALLHALAVRPGQRVLHVGAGTGYYTALLAELVGPGGQVTGVEFDARLAGMAERNLRPWPQARVVRGDGADFPAAEVDRNYVNFAVGDLPDRWLDALAPDGRLLVPLGPGQAIRLLVTRGPDGYAARSLGWCGFIAAEGVLAGDTAQRARLAAALKSGGTERIARLLRAPVPPGEAWLRTPRWALAPDA
jgi:protein-L-isoaspartate(D-aspartate) O-methyltransferase